MKILFLGDSLVSFFDWQQRLQEAVVLNRGVAGETVVELLGRLSYEWNKASDADMVMIMIGTNNLVRDDYTFLPDYQRILKILTELFPSAQVVVTSLLPHKLPWLAPDAVKRINDMILALADRYHTDFIDVYGVFSSCEEMGGTCFLEDGVHLTEEGYERWAQVVEKYLRSKGYGQK